MKSYLTWTSVIILSLLLNTTIIKPFSGTFICTYNIVSVCFGNIDFLNVIFMYGYRYSKIFRRIFLLFYYAMTTIISDFVQIKRDNNVSFNIISTKLMVPLWTTTNITN